jgi:nitrite reductase/ring-hydroxylating ferredoxin subunit
MNTWIGRDLPPIRRDGQDYFLLGHEDNLYLVLDECPHRGGPLKFGFVNAAGEIVCPLHKGVFPVEALIRRASTVRLVEQGSAA